MTIKNPETENRKGKSRQRAKQIMLDILIVLLFAVGIVLIFNKPLSDQLIKQNQTSALSKLNAKKAHENDKKKGDFDFSHVKSINSLSAAKSRLKQVYPVGAIAVPSVGLKLPILKGLSDANMATGGCTMRADQKLGQGNYPLAGHYMTNSGALFSPLESSQIGQMVYLTDMQQVYQYQIYYKQIVSPKSVYLVDNTKKKIVTLITCANGGSMRWAIRGNLIKTSKINKENIQLFQ